MCGVRSVLHDPRSFRQTRKGHADQYRNEVRGDVRKVRLPIRKQAYLTDGAVVVVARKAGGMVIRLMKYISDEYLGCEQQHDKS
ncbi:MAG: hypothetical protein JWL77_350 [Chthonomonadaceae bacterium]|nr:hypothetical protein [Chthonomonadaceae bacterium]